MSKRIVQLCSILVSMNVLIALSSSPCSTMFTVNKIPHTLDFKVDKVDAFNQLPVYQKDGKTTIGTADLSICGTVTVKNSDSVQLPEAKFVYRSLKKPEEVLSFPDDLGWYHTVKSSNPTNSVVIASYKTSDDYTLKYNFKCKEGLVEPEVQITTSDERTFNVDVTGANACLKSNKYSRYIEILSSVLLLVSALALGFYGLMICQKSSTLLTIAFAANTFFLFLVDAALEDEFFEMSSKYIIAVLAIISIPAIFAIFFIRRLHVLICIGVCLQFCTTATNIFILKHPEMDTLEARFVISTLFFFVFLAVCYKSNDYFLIIAFASIGAEGIIRALIVMGVFGSDQYTDILNEKTTKQLILAIFWLCFSVQFALLRAQKNKAALEGAAEGDIEVGLEAKKAIDDST